jgi:3-oxoacyl-[acyl-carrier-protein] synthase III
LILDRSPGRTGFGGFLFQSFTDHVEDVTSWLNAASGGPSLSVTKDPGLECRYLECLLRTVPEFLAAEGLDWSDIALVIPPQVSPAFVAELGTRFKIERGRLVDVTCDGADLFTSSLPHAFDAIVNRKLARPGDVGLIITAGAGIEIGCATYHF